MIKVVAADLVWLDVAIKSSPMVPKVAQKVYNLFIYFNSFYLKSGTF